MACGYSTPSIPDGCSDPACRAPVTQSHNDLPALWTEMAFKYPDLKERQQAAAAAKKALLEKFKTAANDPAIAERQAERIKINEARQARAAEREAAKKAQEEE